MFFGHGLGKLIKLFSGEEIKFIDLFGISPFISFTLAAFAEGIASVMVAAGLFTRLGSLSLVATMAVAAFIAHADDPFARKEKALLFLVSYLLLFLTGPGKYSLHTLLSKKLKRSSSFIRFVSG
jgi:putative oxidoreductase